MIFIIFSKRSSYLWLDVSTSYSVVSALSLWSQQWPFISIIFYPLIGILSSNA